jgi:dienelactone hydrolase
MIRRMRERWRYVALAALVACSSRSKDGVAGSGSTPGSAAGSAPGSAAAPAAVERWATTVVIGAEMRDFVVELGGGTAALVIGTARIPLVDVAETADKIAFTIEKPKMPKQTWERYELVRHGDRADGHGTLGDMQLPIRMVRLADGEAPRSAYPRPQTPKPPFPYESIELVVDAPDGGKLAGTLAMPSGAGPFPVVLLLSGSGQQDRDETIFGHKPFLVVADRLARAGIASYRFDDRGTGKTTGAVKDLYTEIADAGAIVDVLAKQPKIDPKRIGVIGHSSAGAVAPNVAVAHPVAFVALLAGITLSGRDYSAVQTAHSLELTGASADAIAQQKRDQDTITAAAVKDPNSVKAVLVARVRPLMQQQLGHAPSDAEVDAVIAKPLAELTNPWLVSYFRIDPRESWKKLSIPVLLLVGDKDTQVPADMTIMALNGATTHATTRTFPGLNHLFQHAKTGELDEYLTIDETFAPEALDALAGWLGEQTKH